MTGEEGGSDKIIHGGDPCNATARASKLHIIGTQNA